jgi:hypothetical protein
MARLEKGEWVCDGCGKRFATTDKEAAEACERDDDLAFFANGTSNRHREILFGFIRRLQEIGKRHGFDTERWKDEAWKNEHVQSLTGSIDCLLWLHVSSSVHYRFTLLRPRLQTVYKTCGGRRRTRPWYVVLLVGNEETSYLLTADDVLKYVKAGYWQETPLYYNFQTRDLRFNARLSSVDTLVEMLTTQRAPSGKRPGQA